MHLYEWFHVDVFSLVFILQNCLKSAIANWTSTHTFGIFSVMCLYMRWQNKNRCESGNKWAWWARGSDRFQAFVKHKSKQIYILIFQLWYSNWHGTYQLITHWHALHGNYININKTSTATAVTAATTIGNTKCLVQVQVLNIAWNACSVALDEIYLSFIRVQLSRTIILWWKLLWNAFKT